MGCKAPVLRFVSPDLKGQLGRCFEAGNTVVQTDRQIGDAPGRSFHARQLLFGTTYLQAPHMWRQLTFDLPEAEYQGRPDILEVSIPNWLEDLGLSEELKGRIREAGLTQLIFKAPTEGLSLHLGFDRVEVVFGAVDAVSDPQSVSTPGGLNRLVQRLQ